MEHGRGNAADARPGGPSGGPGGVVLRTLEAADAKVYRAFRLRSLREFPTASTSSFEEESAKPLSATVRRLVPDGRPHDAVVGAFDADGELVGAAGLRVAERAHERHKATLFGMAVAPGAAGKGVGTALVRRVLDLAASVGEVVQVGLTVTEGNAAAERLYRSCGFEVWGREPRAVVVGGRPLAKLHMVRMLDPPDGRASGTMEG